MPRRSGVLGVDGALEVAGPTESLQKEEAMKGTEATKAAEAQARAIFVTAVADVVSEGQAQRRLEGLDQTPCCPVMAGQIDGRLT